MYELYLVPSQGNAGKVNTWRINSLSHTLRYWLPMSARDNWLDDYNRLSLLPANDFMFTLSAHIALLQDTILMIILTWLKDLTMKSSTWVTFAWKRENDRHALFGVNDQEKKSSRTILLMIILLLTLTQGSYRFLDPKSKTFSRLFPKQLFLVPNSSLSNRWSIKILKNAGTKVFFMLRCK